MGSRPWYKRYPSDFIAGTIGLSVEEKGAYAICLDLIYDRGRPIPDDARWIAGACGCSIRKWNTLRSRLIEAGKLVDLGGHLTNSRAEKEIENSAKISRKLSENGAKGGRKTPENQPRFNKNNALPEAGLKHRAHKPEARVQNPEEETSTLRFDVCAEPEKSAPPLLPEEPPAIELPAVSGDPVPITEDEVSEWQKSFPAVEVRQALGEMRAWLLANPTRRKTPRGMRRFVVAWLSREQDRPRQPAQQAPPRRDPWAKRVSDEDLTKALEGINNPEGTA